VAVIAALAAMPVVLLAGLADVTEGGVVSVGAASVVAQLSDEYDESPAELYALIL